MGEAAKAIVLGFLGGAAAEAGARLVAAAAERRRRRRRERELADVEDALGALQEEVAELRDQLERLTAPAPAP